MARILVIDDESNIRVMLRLALQHEGHTVESAAEGQEGLDKFGDGKAWDLVLLDQRMPGLSGLAVLQQMRYHDPAAKIIMITAFGTVDLAVEAMKAGATDFLRKPFTVDILHGAVQVALTGSPKLQEGVGSAPMTFGMATINGFHIVSQSGASPRIGEDTRFRFTVQNPEGTMQECTVVLPIYIAELIKAHADREQMPGGARFWQALCEEALANYLYQNAEFPPDGLLRVEEFTSGMRRWVDAVLAA